MGVKKITDEDIANMLKLREDGMTIIKIGEKLEIPRTTVGKYLKKEELKAKANAITNVKMRENSVLIKIEQSDFVDRLEKIINGIDEILYISGASDSRYNTVGDFNKQQTDILHKIEDCATEEDLLSTALELRHMRELRRQAKNELYIAGKVRDSIRGCKMHTDALEMFKERIIDIVNNANNGYNYTPRFEGKISNIINCTQETNHVFTCETKPSEEVMDVWKQQLQSLYAKD